MNLERKSIGIRVEPKEIIYTILNKDEKDNVSYSVESIVVPKALENDVPRQLSFIRTTLYSIICEYNVEFAGLRTAEGNSNTSSTFRINLEGVIQELFSDSTIKRYFAGTSTSIASRLGTNSTKIKDCCSGKENTFNLDSWNNKMNNNKRESVLTALAAIEGAY